MNMLINICQELPTHCE